MYFNFKRKINNIFMKNFIKFYQNVRNFSQKFRKKGEWNQRNSLCFLESLSPDISLSKKIKKIFLIPYSTLDKLSNDTKIDWTKKKPSWVYSSSPPPPPLKRGWNNYGCISHREFKFKFKNKRFLFLKVHW